MILLEKRAHLVLKTPPSVVRLLLVDVPDQRPNISGTHREQSIPSLPREVPNALFFHPYGRSSLNLRHDLRRRSCRPQPHRKMDMVRNAAHSKAFAIQLASRSGHVRVKSFRDVLTDERKPLLCAEHDMHQVETQRLRHSANYMPGLQPSPVLADTYLGLRPRLVCVAPLALSPCLQPYPGLRPRLVCHKAFGLHSVTHPLLDIHPEKQLVPLSGIVLRYGFGRSLHDYAGDFMPTSPNPPTTPEHHRFHFLDGLRGVAAILVASLHPPAEIRQHLTTYSGHLAVDFFFCLSGFVIAFSYDHRLRSAFPWRDFAVARVIRLYPMIFLGTAIGLIGVALNPLSPNSIHMVLPLPLEIWHAFLSFLVLPAVFFARPKDLLYPVDPPMWSLFFEFAANFVFAAMVRLRVASTAILIPLWIVSVAFMAFQRHLHGTFDFGYTVEGLAEGFARVALSFLAGALVCRLYRGVRLPRIHGTAAVLLSLGLTALFLRILCDGSHLTVPAIRGFVEIGLLFPAIVFVGASLALPAAISTLCSFLGEISYPLYLLHDPLFWPLYCTSVRSYFAHSRLAMPVDIAYIAALVLIAWWVARVYDAPVRRWLNQAYRSTQHRNQLPIRTE